jgi:hypothetical protein
VIDGFGLVKGLPKRDFENIYSPVPEFEITVAESCGLPSLLRKSERHSFGSMFSLFKGSFLKLRLYVSRMGRITNAGFFTAYFFSRNSGIPDPTMLRNRLGLSGVNTASLCCVPVDVGREESCGSILIDRFSGGCGLDRLDRY